METFSFSPLWVIPFVLILLCIAILPLAAPHFWENNKNKALISLGISSPVLVLLLFEKPHLLMHSLNEYVSFIILLGSLFVIAGGILLTGDLEAKPITNTLFLALGSVLASIIGTTGASMLLIRPLLKTNSERHHTHHLPIFFIFLVSNVGGLLTPIGDPPLFLGFLRGVPFFWTLKMLPEWAVATVTLLTIFFIWDTLAYKKETKKDIKRDKTHIVPLKLEGKLNFLWLAGVLGCVFLDSPLREAGMLFFALLSHFRTKIHIRTKNHFSFGPIIEVAVLFIGIFIAMVPALELLRINGASLGINSPHQFFWASGILSSFLDNAPTYLTFFTLGQSLAQSTDVLVAGVPETILKAISMGSVTMGAMTYIGNGPNFMVKAIADSTGLKTPSFFGYMLYSITILLPLLVLACYAFI
ncbi:sodium:proton antiporter [bacterium]|nr:sodium:proton antiporter [bacterium]